VLFSTKFGAMGLELQFLSYGWGGRKEKGATSLETLSMTLTFLPCQQARRAR
jgi:hypothetical protein